MESRIRWLLEAQRGYTESQQQTEQFGFVSLMSIFFIFKNLQKIAHIKLTSKQICEDPTRDRRLDQ